MLALALSLACAEVIWGVYARNHPVARNHPAAKTTPPHRQSGDAAGIVELVSRGEAGGSPVPRSGASAGRGGWTGGREREIHGLARRSQIGAPLGGQCLD